ncbi:MAG: protein kinase, partial [Deltaproteobacteria bacterium]|nr:protein kinase [Deltaproteobacteria bacterium]
MSVRDVIVELMASGGEATESPLAVDVLARSGIRTDQRLPDPASDSVAETLSGGDRSSTRSRLPAVLLEGAQLLEDRYAMGPRLGEGGMGVVYLARDRNLGREVALKSILPEKMSDARLARFVTEARITAQLEHPGIVPVHDLFISEEGEVFYSMKRVQGQSLEDVLDELRARDPDADTRYNLIHMLSIFRTACHAVAYAHTRRVVHRDL